MTSSIHIETYGEGQQTIAVCNGLSQSTANWRGIARQTPGFRWILFDARGHGKSALGDEPFTLDCHVADLLEVLAKTGTKLPFLMGFSHGARIALRAAAEHGERFAGLILVSCGSRSTARRKAHVRSWSKCLEIGGIQAMAWASLPTIVGRKILESFPDWEMLIKGTAARNNEQGLRATLTGMAAYPPAEEDARRVQPPALVLRGDEDPIVLPADLDDLCGWIPRATAHTFKQCGHTLPLEEPDSFMETVGGFIEKWAE